MIHTEYLIIIIYILFNALILMSIVAITLIIVLAIILGKSE